MWFDRSCRMAKRSIETLEHLLRAYRDIAHVAAQPVQRTPLPLGPLSLTLLFAQPLDMGHIIQYAGFPGHGKTTLALDLCRAYHAQFPDASVLFLDLECTFDPMYASHIGVDMERLIVVRPETAETAFMLIEDALHADIRLFILDSVPALVPRSERERTFDDSAKVAALASLLTRFCQRISLPLYQKQATILLVNQMRKQLQAAGDYAIPFGGLALQHASYATLRLQRVAVDDDVLTVRVLPEKVKTALRFPYVEIPILRGQGVDHPRDVLTLALQYGILQRNGAWYTYEDQKVQGFAQACNQLPIDRIRERILNEVAYVSTSNR